MCKGFQISKIMYDEVSFDHNHEFEQEQKYSAIQKRSERQILNFQSRDSDITWVIKNLTHCNHTQQHPH